MIHHNKQHGFTLIELMLAMGGIAFLLLFVVFAILQVTGLYTKGVAIRQINQAGRQMTDEISRSVRYGSSPISIPDKHRLCVGGKSYIWNDPDDTTYVNSKVGGGSLKFVVLSGTSYCSTIPATSPSNDIPAVSSEALGNVVMLQNMTITKANPSSPVYELSIILSTNGTNEPDEPAANVFECNPQFGQFCAFGEFETSIYARRE
jgi:prepilin-type N-terminal cleavage/methylation domain-containing protein